MRMKWVGGPLDGCVDEEDHPTSIWVGPDISEPHEKVLIYLLHSNSTYRFDPEATKRANQRLAEQRDYRRN